MVQSHGNLCNVIVLCIIPLSQNHTSMNHHHHLPRLSSSSRATRGGYGTRYSGPARSPIIPREREGLGGGDYSRGRGGLTPNIHHNHHVLSHSQYQPQPLSQYQHQPSQPHEIQIPWAGPDDYYRNRTLGFRPSMGDSKQVIDRLRMKMQYVQE